MKIISKIHSKNQLVKVMITIIVISFIAYLIIDSQFGSSRLLNGILVGVILISSIVLNILWRVVNYRRMKDRGEENLALKMMMEEMKL